MTEIIFLLVVIIGMLFLILVSPVKRTTDVSALLRVLNSIKEEMGRLGLVAHQLRRLREYLEGKAEEIKK